VTSLSPSGPILTLAGVKVQPFAEPVTAENTKETNSAAAALYLLIGADLAEADRSKFLEAFKQGTHWQGVPIGEFEITLADGMKAVQPILYGTHVRSVTREEPLPQVLEALGQEWVGNRMGYLVQWVNSHPETAITSIRFIPGTESAKPVWLGAAARSVREAYRAAE
jgi:hypothetical protein